MVRVMEEGGGRRGGKSCREGIWLGKEKVRGGGVDV